MLKKKQILFFPQTQQKEDIPLVLPKLNRNNREISRTESIEYLGIRK